MPRLADLVRDLKAADAKCKKKDGHCRARSCGSTARGCFSKTHVAEKLRKELQARRPQHPLLALLELPEAAAPVAAGGAERARLLEELRSKDRHCVTRAGCRAVNYCETGEAGCRSTSKASVKLRQRLGQPPAAAPAAAPPAEAAPPAAQRPLLRNSLSFQRFSHAVRHQQDLPPRQKTRFMSCALNALKACPRPGEAPQCDGARDPISLDALDPNECVAIPNAVPNQEPRCYNAPHLAQWWATSGTTTDPVTRRTLGGRGCSRAGDRPRDNAVYDSESEADE